MVLAPSVAGLFKWRQFEPEIILLAVGWYLRFSLSYRDVEELLAERGLLVDHVTVWRWVQRYAPQIQRRLRPRLRPTNDSWRPSQFASNLKKLGVSFDSPKVGLPLTSASTRCFVGGRLTSPKTARYCT